MAECAGAGGLGPGDWRVLVALRAAGVGLRERRVPYCVLEEKVR